MRKRNKFCVISFQQKLRIKSFVETAKRQAFYVDVEGLNELIEVFSFISTSETSDYLTTGQQLSYMWKFVYDFYKMEIENVCITQLRMKKMYMRTKKHNSRLKLKYVNYRDPNGLKTCTKCNEDKLGSEFYWNKDRLQACCKKCMYKIYVIQKESSKKKKKQGS